RSLPGGGAAVRRGDGRAHQADHAGHDRDEPGRGRGAGAGALGRVARGGCVLRRALRHGQRPADHRPRAGDRRELRGVGLRGMARAHEPLRVRGARRGALRAVRADRGGPGLCPCRLGAGRGDTVGGGGVSCGDPEPREGGHAMNAAGGAPATSIDASYYDTDKILRQAAATFFDHLSEMCEGILLVDREARLVWINDRYERYLATLGFSSREQVLGRPIEEVVPNTLMRSVVETGRPILIDVIENPTGTFVVSRIP